MTDAPYNTPTGLGDKDRGDGPMTGRAAADKAVGRAAALRERTFDAIHATGVRGMTADEAAAALNEDELSIRPRVSELRKAGRVVPTGARRLSSRDTPSAVVIAAEFVDPQIEMFGHAKNKKAKGRA